ncbi:hypothetical protein D3C73_670640 [compost metagenome]
MQAITCGVGHQQSAVGLHGQAAGTCQPWQAVIAQQRQLVALRGHLHDAPVQVAHIQDTVVRGGQ